MAFNFINGTINPNIARGVTMLGVPEFAGGGVPPPPFGGFIGMPEGGVSGLHPLMTQLQTMYMLSAMASGAHSHAHTHTHSPPSSSAPTVREPGTNLRHVCSKGVSASASHRASCSLSHSPDCKHTDCTRVDCSFNH